MERAEKVKAVRSALGTMTTKASDFDKRDRAFSRLAAELGVLEAGWEKRVDAIAELLVKGTEC